jgi:hypothetical protein
MTDNQKYQKRYYKKNREKIIKQTAEWYQNNKEKMGAYHTAYYRRNTKKILARSKARWEAIKNDPKVKQQAKKRGIKYKITRSEYISVRSHYDIIMGKYKKVPCYYKMPFFNGWNPKKGGSFQAGEDWIIENIGKRPGKNYQLHIVDRKLGFVPNNLEWVPRDKHKQNEMINRLLLENKKLKATVNKLKKRTHHNVQAA